jgi:hypothetical protein
LSWRLHLSEQKHDPRATRFPEIAWLFEKVQFLPKQLKFVGYKMSRKLEKSFVGHPSAILFLRISGEGVFQQQGARPMVGAKRKGTCLDRAISAS